MTPTHWRQINSLFQEAVDRPRPERTAFLDEVCSGDEDSRKEVQSLISFHERAQDFLEVPALEAAAGWLADDQADSRTGQLIGSYKIGPRLGSGGMGEVYLAEDTKLGRKVAIKFLPIELEEDDLARRRQIREAKAAARLDHPNICGIHEVAKEAGHSFIVMQYVEGETLAARMRRRPFELSDSMAIALQVADALCLAHSLGLVHRDIKPQNIMITPRGQAKVLDFGLVKLIPPKISEGDALDVYQESRLSTTGVIVGTVGYMSPEQVKGETVDARTDIFSLGVVLYECVTGKCAFPGNTPVEVSAQVIHVNPPPPSHLNPSVPTRLDHLILKALAKDRDLRHQSAEQLMTELHAVLDADEMLTRPLPLDAGRSSGKHLTTLVSAARRPRVLVPAVVMALALFSAPLWWPATPHRPQAEALHWYELGTAALRDGTYYKASKALERAILLDDTFAIAHARLAEAWTEMDYSERAKDELLRVSALEPSSLPHSESLYVRAITNTVLRDFVPALQSYQEISKEAPNDERSQVYVDLGRAYEKNDQLDEAKQNYLEATQLSLQDPTAFLRLGFVYAQQQDYANAARAFDTAQSLYETLSNVEGVVEVLYQRGVLLANLGKLPDARAQVQNALEMARNIDSKQQQIRALLELSRIASTGGETAQAQRHATEAMELAQLNEMENLLTQGLIELGNAFRVHGDYGQAEKYLDKALELAQRNKGRLNEARAHASLGGLLITVHDADKGLEHLNQALPFYERGGYRREAAMVFHHFGRAYELKGDIAASRQAHDEELRLAEQVNDPYQQALAHRGIGLALAYQEHYPEGLGHFKESLSIYKTLGNQLSAGNRLIDCGDMLWRLGRYRPAQDAFEEAISIAEQPSVRNKQMWDTLSLVEAHMQLSARHFSEAMTRGKRALALNAENQHATEAKYVIGLAQALSGAKREGLRLCLESVQEARSTTYAPILSGALLALAETMLENGDAPGALSNAREAQARFEVAGQHESEWQAWLLAARASSSAGDAMKAREYATVADALLSSLQQQWGTEAYNDYLTRPDVVYCRTHLSHILSASQ
jgi:serine/threonine protein kinase/Tfp pilus assembly protein PilF